MHSGLKSRLSVISSVGIVLIVVTFIFLTQKDCTPIFIGSDALCVEVVATEVSIEQGLSGRKEIGADGMLFIMPSVERYIFWMKDMEFPIDIVWINESDTVTQITHNLTPESYPATFRSHTPARKVLEVPAGKAQTAWIGEKLVGY